MRNLKIGARSPALFIAMVVVVLFVPSAVAMVWTDKTDYSPGETVTISGDNSDSAGYLAGETVHVGVSGPYDYTASCDGVADGNGAWSCQVTLRDDESAEGDYSYTATGQTSGVSQSGTFTDQAGGSPANCVTAGGFPPSPFTVSDQGFRDSNAAVGDLTVDLDVQNDAPGFVITKICVRSFLSSFALGGSGGDANSQAGGSALGTSPHSIPITADGSAGDPTRYGIDNEPGDAQNGCFTVTGIGTRSVSVTRAPTVDGAPNCLDVQHLDLSLAEAPPAGESEITTEVHLADHTAIDNGNPATTGAMVHDTAHLTFSASSGNALPSGSSTTFYFWNNNTCDGTAADSASFDVSGSASPVDIEDALPKGPLADGGYSYRGVFTSGDELIVPSADSGCEPFSVGSSIIRFEYQIGGTGPVYDCTTLNGSTNCGTVAWSKKGATKYDFLVHVGVANTSGVTKDVKVQGGLAAQATYWQSVPGTHALGTQITTFPSAVNDVGCGNAQINLSNSNNVVTWIINDMPNGATCDLYIYVRKGYSSKGLQPVTSSWSQVDCGFGTVASQPSVPYPNGVLSALGETKPGCVKSNYTGNLLVNVT